MKINTYFAKSKNELQNKIIELNYLKEFYSAVEKFSVIGKLKFEVYQDYNKTFSVGDEKLLIEKRFDLLHSEFEKHIVLPAKGKSTKFPFFGCRDVKAMTSFMLNLNNYGIDVWPYFQFEGQKIFLTSEERSNNAVGLGIFGWNRLKIPDGRLVRTDYKFYNRIQKSSLNPSLINSILDFCSCCREKNQTEFLSEYDY
jgi:hypothetical protein